MKEAMFYRKLKGGKTQCYLCPRGCVISHGRTGFCGVRRNDNGILFSLVYGKACALHTDPIEKKPLFHFAPGSRCLSLATVGCNLDCQFCQNWEISHPKTVAGEDIPPERVVSMARSLGLPGIAYTYTEPTIFFEYAYETMRLAKKEGLYNIWVSNGYTSPEAIKKASKYLDAINVDLKGGHDFYREVCGVPDEKPIYRALKLYKELGIFIEVTTLVIPGHNDSRECIERIVKWVKENLGPETPMHFSRFYPHFRMLDVEPTPVNTLETAARIALDNGMQWVYIGNVPGHERENTLCPECGEILVKRTIYETKILRKECRCGRKLLICGERWMRD